MTKQDAIDDMIDKAAMRSGERFLLSFGRSEDSPHWRNYCAEQVGKIVLGLPAEQRAQLRDLTAGDLKRVFFGYGAHMRPEYPVRRRARGPVCLG